MPEPIPYGRQSIDDDDVAAVEEILRSDYLTTGPAIARFESAVAAASGARRAVAVNSGTAALHAMYFAAGIGPDDEIVTSPLTFASTANAALFLGASVRFADVDARTGNIDPSCVAELLGPRTRATDRGRRVGTLADASALSFHPVKPITTGEGGAVTTDDDALAARAARFRTHGMTRDPDELERNDGPWFYEQHDLGFNYRLTDVQAALGTSQLRRLGEFIARRRAIAARYDQQLAHIEGLELPTVRAGAEPGWHLYVVMVRDAGRRSAFFERLRASGLGVQVHYIPVYLHPYYRRLGYEPGLCPVAEDRYARSVSLPIFPRMSDDDVSSVVERVSAAAADTL
jgi:perosamine synthetase